MAFIHRRSAGLAALVAAGSLAAAPTAAAPLPSAAQNPAAQMVWDTRADVAHGYGDRYGRYYGYGRYGGRYGRYGHYRRDRGIDGGDVLAGIIILGGVIAVANAANRRDRERSRERYPRDVRYPDRDYRSRDYRDRRYADSGAARGIDAAIEQCVREVERDRRVSTVESAERDGTGWIVEGRLGGGGDYRCELDAEGRIRDIDLIDRTAAGDTDGRYARAPAYPGGPLAGEGRDDREDSSRAAGADSHYDDEYYAGARERQESAQPPVESAPDGTQDWQRGEADDRYETADGPDYALAL